MEWISFHPGMEEIPRALATDYLTQFGVKGVRFGLFNNDDSILLLGQYGYPDAMAWRNRTISGQEWRAIESLDVKLIISASGQKWSDDSRFFVNTLRDHGVIQGYLSVEFTNPIADTNKQKIADAIDDLCLPIALYLSFQFPRSSNQTINIDSRDEVRDSGGAQLSSRQLSILQGMVDGKTNHELAIELGFSVSTVRHETMRIFQALAVSDRKEAAKKGLTLNLI